MGDFTSITASTVTIHYALLCIYFIILYVRSDWKTKYKIFYSLTVHFSLCNKILSSSHVTWKQNKQESE